MAERDKSEDTKENPSRIFGLIAIIAGILVIVSGYIVYNYFNQTTFPKHAPLSRIEVDKPETNVEDEKINEGIVGLIGEGTSTVRQEEDNQETAETIQTQPYQAKAPWTANNYEFGDIETGNYTVISGDTLWEIAEAVYGSGSDWHKIADANNVGYLSNGNPLIVPGQVLSIPAT